MRSSGSLLWTLVVVALSVTLAGCESLPNQTRSDDGATTPRTGGNPAGNGDRATDGTGTRDTTEVEPPTPTGSGWGGEAADEIPGHSVTSLKIRTGRGSVTIIGDPSARKISARASIRSQAENVREAERIVREITVRFVSRTTENPSLILNEPHLSASQDYTCDLTITLPPTVRVSLDNSGGNASISSLGSGLDVVHSGGKLSIVGVKGGVEVRTTGTEADLQELSGKVSIKDGKGSLLIQLVTGEVVVDDESGTLQVRFVTGNVTARNNPDRPEFQNIDGDLTLVGIVHNNAKVEGVLGRVSYPSDD